MTAVKALRVPEAHRRWLLVLLALLAVLALLLLCTDCIHLLTPKGTEADKQGFKDLTDAINNVKGPANVALASVSGLGLIAGAGMTAMGMPQGMRMMTMSGLSGGGVILGNGIVA